MSQSRQKASDVFHNAEFLFAKKGSFTEAFPEIEDVDVIVVENGTAMNDWNRKRYYKKENIGEYINCSFSLCYNGGFSIGRILREMVAKKETTHINKCIMCQGHKGSPKGRRNYGPCSHWFEVEVKIKYKSE